MISERMKSASKPVYDDLNFMLNELDILVEEEKITEARSLADQLAHKKWNDKDLSRYKKILTRLRGKEKSTSMVTAPRSEVDALLTKLSVFIADPTVSVETRTLANLIRDKHSSFLSPNQAEKLRTYLLELRKREALDEHQAEKLKTKSRKLQIYPSKKRIFMRSTNDFSKSMKI